MAITITDLETLKKYLYARYAKSLSLKDPANPTPEELELIRLRYSEAEVDPKLFDELRRQEILELKPLAIKEGLDEDQNKKFIEALKEFGNSLKRGAVKVGEGAATVGTILGYSLAAGVSETDRNIVNLARLITQGFVSLSDKVDELVGMPENWSDPYKRQAIESLTNLVKYYEQSEGYYLQKVARKVEEIKNPAAKVVAEGISGAVRALPQVLLTYLAGVGMPTPTGIAAQLPKAQFVSQITRMIPFGALAGSAHAREVEKELEALGGDVEEWKMYVAFAIGGFAEMATESPVFESFMKTIGSEGLKNLTVNLVKDAAINAAQEAIMEPIEMSYKQLLSLPQDWSLKNLVSRMGNAGLVGAFLGLLVGGSLYGSEKARERIARALVSYNNGEIEFKEVVNEVHEALQEDIVKEVKAEKPEGVSEEPRVEIPEAEVPEAPGRVEEAPEATEEAPEVLEEIAPEETVEEVQEETIEETPKIQEPIEPTQEEIPEEATKEEAATQQEIWQMPFEKALRIIDPYWEYADSPQSALEAARRKHLIAVQRAFEEGLPVPEDVLREYLPRLEAETVLRNIPSRERAESIAASEGGRVVPDNANEGAWMVIRPKSRPQRMATTESAEGLKVSLEPKVTTEKTVSKLDIIKYIEDEFKVPVRGRATTMRGKRSATGLYYPFEVLIRTRKWGELGSLAHEVAHHIERQAGPDRSWLTPEAKNEFAKLDYVPLRLDVSEGFAEYVRYRLTQGVSYVRELAPHAHAAFETLLSRHPALRQKFLRLEEMYETYRHQGAVERVLQHIDWEGKAKKVPLRERVAQSFQWLQKEFFEQYFNIKRLVEDAKELSGKLPSPLNNPVILIKYFRRRASAWARTIVFDAFVDEYGRKIGPSLKEVLSPIPAEQLKEFLAYMVCLRAETLHRRGIDTGLLPEDVEYFIRKYDNPTWRKVAEEFTNWCNNAISLLVQAGGISQEAARLIREANPFYVTFKRILTGETREGLGGKLANLPQTPKQILGSGRMLENVLEATIDHVTSLLVRVQKLHIIRAIIELQEKVPGLGRWIIEVPPPLRAVQFKLDQLSDVIKNIIELTGGEKKKLPPEVLEEIATVFVQSPYTGKDNIVFLWHNGRRRFFEVHPELYAELMAVDAFVVQNFFKVARVFVDLVRFGAVEANPAFIAANFIRDLGTFLVRSKAKFPAPWDTLVGVFQGLTAKPGSPVWRAIKMGLEISTPSGLYRTATQKLTQEFINEKMGFKGKLKTFLSNPAAFLERISQFIELGPRVREFWKLYNEYLKKGYPEPEAFVLATVGGREVTVDFSEGGNLAKSLNLLIPFFSANIQGPIQTLRSLKERPVQTIVRGIITLTLLSLAMWFRNKDKDWYKNLRPEFKYNNIFVQVDEDTIIRLPLPWEVGIFFAGLPVAVLDYLREKNGSLYRGIVGMLERIMPDMQPAIIEPIIDILRNTTYGGTPIETPGMRYEYPTERKRSDTTKLAISLSKFLDRYLNLKVSPVQLDYLFDQYTGGLYRRLWNIAANILTGKVDAKNLLKESGLVRRFVIREPSYPSYQLDRFFADREELVQKRTSGIITKEELKKLIKIEAVYGMVKQLLQQRKKLLEEKKEEQVEKVDERIRRVLEKAGYQ